MDRMFRRWLGKLVWALVVVVLTVLLTASPIGQQPDSVCDAEQWLTSRPTWETRSATWAQADLRQGRHQAYGVFALPDRVAPGTPVLLQVRGIGVYCDRAVHTGRSWQGIEAPIGHYWMQDHIRSRSAIVAILTGQGPTLQDPRNWTLSYPGTP
jgi:hypothetical protein